MLQDLWRPLGKLHGDPVEHRINVPGTVAPTNWSWRCPVTMEELLEEGAESQVFPR